MEVLGLRMKSVLAVATALCASALFAWQGDVMTPTSYTGIFSVGPDQIYHVKPGGSIEVSTKNGNNYIEIRHEVNKVIELWLEGGSVQADVLALRGAVSKYRQFSGTASFPGNIYVDGGTLEIAGGVCKGPISFRNCSAATFIMSGGTLVSTAFGGANMGKAGITFALTNAAHGLNTDTTDTDTTGQG